MSNRSRTNRRRLRGGIWLAALLGACDGSRPGERVTILGSSTAQTSPTAAPAAPRIVRLDPPNGATNVDPRRATLAVTFDRPMDRQGWSWVMEGPESAPDLGEAAFDAAGQTHTVDARLLPGRTYVVWINSARYSYFRSAEGVPSEPLRWTFTTSPAAAVAGSPPPAASLAGPPHVVLLDPPNGATGVDPAQPVLRATFDRPMQEGWSWVTESDNFPEAAGKAYFEPDGRTAALPVRLRPGRTYVIWLNSEQYQMFRDQRGIPAPPLRWVFSTRTAG